MTLLAIFSAIQPFELVPEIIAVGGAIGIVAVIVFTVYDHRFEIVGYFMRRFSRPLRRLGCYLYKRIFRFVSSWLFWWTTTCGDERPMRESFNDALLRPAVFLFPKQLPPASQCSVIRGR